MITLVQIFMMGCQSLAQTATSISILGRPSGLIASGYPVKNNNCIKSCKKCTQSSLAKLQTSWITLHHMINTWPWMKNGVKGGCDRKQQYDARSQMSESLSYKSNYERWHYSLATLLVLPQGRPFSCISCHLMTQFLNSWCQPKHAIHSKPQWNIYIRT